MEEKWEKIREKAFEITRKKLREAVTKDQIIIQTITTIEELERTGNSLSKKLREWYELYSPEFSAKIKDHETFAKLIIKKNREEQLKEIKEEKTIGADMKEEDIKEIKKLAEEIRRIYELKEEYEEYLDKTLEEHAPNTKAIAGKTITAKLIREAGSLKKLATIQASTIQMYGAEKALFRHLKTGAKPPKYGYIINHPLITGAEKKEKGKIARALADKISIAARVDYFKGERIGEKLRKELEERFKK